MSLIELQEKLENKAKKKLKLHINDNRSTMLSVKWEPDHTRVSMHRMFLKAPENVMEELACYLRKKNQTLPISVKAYIEEELKDLNYSSRINAKQLITQGNIYNLREMYQRVNRDYFNDQLDLQITWFGKQSMRKKNKVVLGLYCETLKLVKIHRMLDSPKFPEYLVSFIIYHEMLHHVCPSYIDKQGIRRMHDSEFKKRERQFRYYELANHWIKKNQPSLFMG